MTRAGVVARIAAFVGAATLSASGAPALAQKAPSMTLTDKDNNRTIDLHVGEAFDVSLPENASTGYRWAIDHYDQGLVQELSSDSSYPAQRPGAAGTRLFAFQAKKPGTGEIALKNWRSWEGDSSVASRFRVGLRVAP